MPTTPRFVTSLSALLLLGGCVALQMKAPPKTAVAAEWRVTGHVPRSNGRDRHLRIDAYEVGPIEGTAIAPAGLAAYGRVADQRAWDYRFDFTGNGRTLHADCTEAVDHARWHGFGEMLLNLTCTCSEAGAARVTITFADEKGSLDFGGGVTLPITAAHDSEQGKHTGELLGYRVGKGESTGGVDITKSARAFVPKNLPADHQAALACGYAALLLHRPVK